MNKLSKSPESSWKSIWDEELKIKLYNSLSRKIDKIVPIEDGLIKIYGCWITVYGECHVWHASQAIFFDILRNYFEYLWQKVIYVRNFTDVDDKIINKAKEEWKKPLEISDYYIEDSIRDLNAIKVKPATYQPRVSEHIPDIINFISWLIGKWYAYEANWEVLFEVKQFKDYWKLSGQKVDNLESWDVSSNKKSPEDFSLWKPAKEWEIFRESPRWIWRPWWHIECSTMADHYLWETIDIHWWGLDLMFPHHENEIAQSEAYHGKPFANCRVHNWLIKIDWRKMWKSLWNTITIKSLLERYNADIIRFAILTNHYSSEINITRDLFVIASKRVYFFYSLLKEIDDIIGNNKIAEGNNLLKDMIDKMNDSFRINLDNNLNIANFIADLSVIFKDIWKFQLEKYDTNDKAYSLSLFKDSFLRLMNVIKVFDENPKKYIENYKLKILEVNWLDDVYLQKMIQERNEYKQKKNYEMADKIRNELINRGIDIKDTKDWTTRDIKID